MHRNNMQVINLLNQKFENIFFTFLYPLSVSFDMLLFSFKKLYNLNQPELSILK